MKRNMLIIEKKAIGFFICVVLLVSCRNKVDDDLTPSNNLSKAELIKNVNTEGNIDSYNSFLFNYPDDIGIIPLSVNMVEKYSYGKACSSLFYTMYSAFSCTSVEMDSIMGESMLYYLNKGVELKDTDCVWIICKLYLTGTLVERDTSAAKRYLSQIYSSDEIDTLYWPYLKKHPNI